MTTNGPASAEITASGELIGPLCSAYAELLRRQGHSGSAFVRWAQQTGRSHAFVWLGGSVEAETVLSRGEPLAVHAAMPIFNDLQKMRATVTLNPYERDLMLGYPYVIGRREGEVIRGPVLLMPVRLDGGGGQLQILASDEVARFNSLPFRGEGDSEARELAIRQVIDATPSLPLGTEDFRRFIDILVHTLSVDRANARLDGTLVAPPAMPTRGDGLWLIDQAAIFIAPKTAYFLVSDLTTIGKQGATSFGNSCIASLLERADQAPQVDITVADLDRKTVYYPFPSNRAQRRAAILVEDPTTRLIRIEGPPGTGKSLTIANLACHLAATGKSVLITSQKDKALQVVDEKLRELNLPELPMTLLRQTKTSKQELLDRLARIKKERARDEVERDLTRIGQSFTQTGEEYLEAAASYGHAIEWEELVERAHRAAEASSGLRKLIRRGLFAFTRRKAERRAPQTTDDLAIAASQRRNSMLTMALKALQVGREFAVAAATRQERQGLRELAGMLQRNQTAAKNFSLFDRLKADPQRARMLLKLLPVWILAPEDVARLFPCEAGIFDVVIADEASQVDLPSITPVVYRGKKIVVFGDTKQMQPRRFAFMNANVVSQAWQHAGMDRLDPERWLHPAENSLLVLTNVRAEEENLLDEHFRSLPPLIQFSNETYYHGELRIMTDERQKAFGHPDQPIAQLHFVSDARISNGSQENETEARALIRCLAKLVTSEDYSGASIGVMALFEEQAVLLQELVAEDIPEEEWEEHDIVVVTPDGFQGDERDVILYSLSWDNNIMPRQSLSQRQRNHPHEQGMLNVAFTRARDEIHIFHSAPIETFTLADGRPGTLTRWLQHCASVQAAGRPKLANSRIGQVDSEFEAEVAVALRARGIFVLHQYPACGFHIDLVCEKDGARVAVECDGERYHLDEHGQPKVEDIEREATLRRAGWRVIRVPYRKWLRDRDVELAKILGALDEEGADRFDIPENGLDAPSVSANESGATPKPKTIHVTRDQEAILRALREGITDEERLLYRARDLLKVRRLTAKLRDSLLADARELSRQGLVSTEEHEYFLTPQGRTAALTVIYREISRPPKRYRHRRRR